MTKEKKGETPSDPAQEAARYVSSDADKAKARKWFERAKELFESKSLDFAIKCYWDGLALWPEAVEEAHQPLRQAAYMRNLTGGKKLGFTDTMKFPMTGKDAKKAMLNAEWLLSHDPANVSYMEGILKNANKLHCEEVIFWIGPIYSNAAENEKKANPKRFALLREVYEGSGDRAMARNEAALAVESFERASAALRLQRQADPKDNTLENELRDLSTKLTILKGKYETAGTYQESIRDADQQKEIYDRDRLIQGDVSLRSLVTKAEQEVAANPANVSKIKNLVDLLCKQENEAHEKRAIGLLVEKYKELQDYQLKVFAEDIRIKQLRRAARKAKASGDPDRARELATELLRFELRAYHDRIKAYPTDHRLKFLYASRLVQAGKYDDAIPLFQIARADSKIRPDCDLHMGRCFFERKFHAQAIGTLTKAVASYELADSQMGKDLRYWLARSLEAAGRLSEAEDVLGQVMELDYNFRDVRDRLARVQEQNQGDG